MCPRLEISSHTHHTVTIRTQRLGNTNYRLSLKTFNSCFHFMGHSWDTRPQTISINIRFVVFLNIFFIKVDNFVK